MNREIEFFPVIRIFGTTKSGQKCCVNIHKYFPYFYIGITKDNYFNYNNKDTLQAFAVLLEKTFIEYRNEMGRMSLLKNEDKDNSQIIKEQEEQVIHNITPVYKTNIYGYYKKESVFLKVECYNPGDIKDLMYVLNQGSVNNNFYQCYDAHISYSTHFFGDYHLFGMGTIKIKNFSFREGIPDKSNDIDFNKKFTFFENNIQWENSPNGGDENINNINQEITEEEIINFINKYNDFMIWDKKYIDLMNFDIKYNMFNKSSNSQIEIDCTIDDIIVDHNKEDAMEEQGNNENKNINDSFADVNKEVNISNLKNHITHCTSLIDLWKEEIKRRKNNNLPPLIFEKISNQGVFTLTEDFFLTRKEESEYLLKLNYEIKENYIDLEELQFLTLEDNNVNDELNISFSNRNDIRQMIKKKLNYRNKYMEKFAGHSYEWYKEHYNKSLFQNIYEIITKQTNEDEQILTLDDETNDRDYNLMKEDYEFDLSCFDPERTLNELSITNNTRNLYKGILNNKTLEDCKQNKNQQTPSAKGNKDDEFNLGESSIKKLFFSEEKDDNKISKGKYILLADSAMKKIIEKNASNKKRSQISERSTEEIECDINTLFYSDYNDYKRFYKIPLKYNPRFAEFKGNSLEYLFGNHNKIIFKPKKKEFELINR